MGHPIQIISFDGDRKLKLNKGELEKIVGQNDVQGLPIAVLSVIGAFRTGKSFLLNWMERYLSSDVKGPGWIKECKSSKHSNQPLEGFKWRSGSQSETQGIWAWSEVFVIDDSAGDKIGVLLVDTQGLFDSNNTLKQNGNIFTLSTLISSIQIFNLSQKMQEDNLGNLELFAEFGRRALTKVNRNSMSSLKPFQRIIFLIRDWPYPKENAYGAQGGKDHLESYLKVTKEKEGNELGDRRRHVDECFDQVDCYLMPHPGKKVANDDGNFHGRLSEMKEPFKEHLDNFLTFLFPDDTVEPKTVAGSPILAIDLPSYIESYINLLNSDESLSAQSIFQATAKIHNNVLARDAKKEYKSLITALENLPGALFLSEDDLRMNHEDFKKTIFEHFERNQMDDAESSSKMLDQLNKDIEEELINWKSRNDRLKEHIVSLNENALKNAVNMYTSAMNESLKSSKIPFFSPEELNEQHQMMKNAAIDHLKGHSKGPDDFILLFLDHLQQNMEDHFSTVITPLNESKTKMEFDRLEMIELEKKRKEEKARRKEVEAEAVRKVAADEIARREAAEAEAARQIERAEQREKEHQIQLEQQRERAKERLETEQKLGQEVKRGLEEELRLAREKMQCSVQ